jgi:transposase
MHPTKECPMSKKKDSEAVVREIKRKTRRRFSAEEEIRMVLEGLRGEDTIAGLCRREGIRPNLYYNWSKEFLEAGQQRLMGKTKRQADSTKVTELRRQKDQLKHLVADWTGTGRPLSPDHPEWSTRNA